MTIVLNGSPHEITGTPTLRALLDSLGLAGKPVVVEMDEEAVFPREYGSIAVRDGARIEVVTLAAGG